VNSPASEVQFHVYGPRLTSSNFVEKLAGYRKITIIIISSSNSDSRDVLLSEICEDILQGSHSFTDKKSRTFPGLSKTPMNNFSGPVQSL